MVVGRSRAVDGLRGVAVLLVLFHHLDVGRVLTHPLLWPLRVVHEAGFLGVSLFLVLSGFSIHLRVAAGGVFAVRPFLVRRFLRLQPTYYAALGIAAVVALVSALAGHPWPHPRWGDSEIPVPLLVASHATVLLATLIPAGWLALTWSLALEQHLYLVYASLVGRLRRVPPVRWLVGAVLVCLAFRLGAQLVLPSVPKSFPPSTWASTLAFQQAPARLAEWTIGAYVAERYARGRLRMSAAAPAVALAGVWLLFEHRGGWTSLNGHPFAVTDLFFDPAAGLAFGLLLVACLAAEQRGRPTPGPLVWLGERSYSFYLVHAPIVGTTFALSATLLVAAPGRVAVALLATGLSLLAAAALHRWVEAPCTAWSQRPGRSPDRRAAPAGEGGDPVLDDAGLGRR